MSQQHVHTRLPGKCYGLLLIPAQSEVYINPRSQDRWLASNSTSSFYIMIVIKIFIWEPRYVIVMKHRA